MVSVEDDVNPPALSNLVSDAVAPVILVAVVKSPNFTAFPADSMFIKSTIFVLAFEVS